MANFSLVDFSVRRPKLIVATTVVLTLLFLTQFPRIKTDTNPKHMLPETSDVRVWNNEVDKVFALYEDTVVVGVRNDAGVLNRETLGRIARITDAILKLEGVASRDVNGFTTITNVTSEAGTLKVGPLMPGAPRSQAEVEALRGALFGNPLFVNRIVSPDGKTTAVYVPLEKGANGAEVAEKLRAIVAKESGPERYYIAGDPVARDTFGAEMFKLMGIFSPIAGMIMFAAIQLMFRNLALSLAMMAVAMAAIIWSMGLLIGAGFPVHIMSSMAPVFLMAIATDSIHIFNEFYFRYREKRDKLAAIRETMQAVSRPVRYTALATAAGFAVLLFMNIIPVKVFGGLIAFGTVVLRLFSFSLIPAILTFVKEEKLVRDAATESVELDRASRLLRRIGEVGATRPLATVLVGLFLLLGAIVGTSKIHVNNNLVAWFKESSEIRVADAAMNQALGGTSLGYLVVLASEPEFMKRPEALRWLEGLQRHLERLPVVGKTFSVADYVKRVNQVLHDDDKKYDAVPDTREAIGQYLFLFSMSAKPSDLDNVVDATFQKANVWVQLKTWDADAMRQVIQAAENYHKAHPLPVMVKPAGIAYFNLVWNDEVLGDMVRGFVMALVVVFLILAFSFRSAKWALVGYMPLLFTILLIYGVVGFAGKDFDMPLSVLSTLSLGMAVDFSIHFISRFRQRLAETGGDVQEALLWTAARPGKGIFRNALLFAAAFSVMLFAPLTPYIAVGAFIVAMMMLSALLTILYLPALIMLGRNWLLDQKKETDMKNLWLCAIAALLPLQAMALSGEEAMRKSQAAFLYPGKDFKARVVMKLINKDGQERVRELTMLRKNAGEPGGEQKYFMYFFQPADVKDMTFMTYKYPAKDDDRWLFIPALNMVKRIAAQDKRSSFVGSDFTYEDVSGRDIEDDNHVIEREEKVGGRDCYLVKSTPKGADADFGHKFTWVDKANFLPLKEEQYDKRGNRYKLFTADEIADIKGFPTPIRRTMKNLQTAHRTEVVYVKTDYDLGIEDNLFSERFLRQPPRKWVD